MAKTIFCENYPMKKVIAYCFVVIASAVAASYSPNPDAGMVSVSMDEESLQNLLSVYENVGYHDLKLTGKLNEVEQIKRINTFYFHNLQIGLKQNDIDFQLDGTIDVNAQKKILGAHFYPHVKTKGIDASAKVFLKDFGVTNDDNVHLNICLSEVETDVSKISYGYVFILEEIAKAWGDDFINSAVKNAVDEAILLESQGTDCIDITNYVTLGYPKFFSPIGIQHSGAKVENGKILAYGCPVPKTTIGDVVVIGDGPCETVEYKVAVHTAEDIDNAGTDSKITLSLCGDDVSGNTRCLKKELDGGTGKGDKAFLTLESSSALVKNLSLTLESDNTGKKPGWYVDSVSVDMVLPNRSAFHYWFPMHTWIGGSSPSSYTFNQRENLQVYTFSIETGVQSRFDHAGTNAKVTVDICDVNNECLSFKLDKDSHDDFEKGAISTYTVFSSKKLAEAKSLTLHHSNSGSHPGWYVQDVQYQHYSFPENIDHSLKDGQGFMFRQWLAEGETKGTYYTTWKSNDISATRYVKDNYGYNVVVKTKNGGASGTDADIILTLEGCSGEIEQFNLNDDRDNFEKGDSDDFRLSGIKNLKGIKKVSLYNDGSGDGPGWNPEYISIVPISFYGNSILGYYKNPENGFEIGTYNKSYHHTFENAIGKKSTWTSGELECPDIQKPSILPAAPTVHPGDYIKLYGINLNENQNITMKLAKDIKPVQVTRDFAIFHIPEDTPLKDYVGEYENGQAVGTVFIDGMVQFVYILVRGEKPVLDGIAISTAEPGDAFEASMRNISDSSRFYLGDVPLKTLSLSKKGVYLQVPKTMENGVYKFRAEFNGWDVVYDETIEIVKSLVPHLSSISEKVVYTGQLVNLHGKNFGDDLKSVKVLVGDKEAEITSLDNEKIMIRIPSGVSGKDISVRVVREEIPAPETLMVEIKGFPWFMSFDDVEHFWKCDNATLLYDDSVKYGDFGYSLKIHGDGYKSIVSPAFNTYELGAISDELLLDVWIPENQINPYWHGDVQMSINIPAAGLYNVWLGQVLLTGLPPGWNTLSFKLKQNVYDAFAGDYPNATFTIIWNANQNSEDFRIDNLRFGGNVKIRTTEHVVAGNILDVHSANFMSFDNINDWRSNGWELLFVESPKIQGLGATGVMASGYTEIQSRSFVPSELEYISNVISLDVYVPNPQPNDYWVGDIGLSLSCPDNGIYSMHLGRADLTHMFREEYNNVQFTMPNEAIAVLRDGVGKCSFSIYLNVNNGAGTFLLDNMGFINILEVAGR